MVQETDPLVSICIANFNGKHVIADCIQSVLDQTESSSYEIIVHDDCSTDNSLEILKDFHNHIELIVASSNVGFCIANNRMVARARGCFILLLNNDACLEKNALKELYQFAKDSSPCILSLPQYDAVSHELLDCGMNMDIFANPIPLKNFDHKTVAMVMGSCLWAPKSLWQVIGGFPEWFESIGEDMFLCCAARRMGFEIHMVQGSKYFHHVGHSFGGGKVLEGGLSSTYKRRALSEKNKTRVMLSTYPLVPLLFVFPLHLVFLCIEGLAVSASQRKLKPFSEIYLPAISAVLTDFKKYRKIRQKLHQTKTKGSAFFSSMRIMPYKLNMLIEHGFPTLK